MRARGSGFRAVVVAAARPVVTGLVAGLVVTGLAACSSSAPPVLHQTPTITANGQHYAFAGTVSPSQWPDPCDYITRQSAAGALTSAVNQQRFDNQCLYIPENADQPVLVVETAALGPDLSAEYDSLRARTGGHPSDVRGVGEQACIAEPLARRMTMTLLVRQGLFQLQLRSPAGNPIGSAKGRAILSQLGRAIATEFD